MIKNWKWMNKHFELQWQPSQKILKSQFAYRKRKNSNLLIFNFNPSPMFIGENRINIKLKYNLISIPVKPCLQSCNIERKFNERSATMMTKLITKFTDCNVYIFVMGFSPFVGQTVTNCIILSQTESYACILMFVQNLNTERRSVLPIRSSTKASWANCSNWPQTITLSTACRLFEYLKAQTLIFSNKLLIFDQWKSDVPAIGRYATIIMYSSSMKNPTLQSTAICEFSTLVQILAAYMIASSQNLTKII